MAKAKQPEAKKPVPAAKASGTAVSTKVEGGGDLILVGDKQDLSHIKNTQRGNENVGTEDLVIPRLEVVQGLSEALKTGQPGYIEGAKQGDLVNSVTNRNYGREVFVVPVHYTKQWLVWKDFNHGGGFFGAFGTQPEAADKAAEEGGEKNHIEVVDTPTHLCLLVDPSSRTVEEIMIPLAKTKAKVSRAWNTQIKLAGGDRFARVYRIGTAMEKNKRGQEYWNFVIGQCGSPAPALYTRAEKLFESLAKGRTYAMDTKGMKDANEPDPDAEM